MEEATTTEWKAVEALSNGKRRIELAFLFLLLFGNPPPYS